MIESQAGWRIGDAVLALFAGLAAALVAQIAVGMDNLSVMAVFGVVVPAQTFTTVGVVAVMARRRFSRPGASLGVGAEERDLFGLLIGAGLQVLLSILTVLVVEVVQNLGVGDVPEQQVVDLAGGALTGGERVAVMIAAIVLAPLAEELVFRGVLLRALLHRWGERAAVYGSAVAFGGFHLIDPNAAVAVPALIVMGIVLARQVMRTGRIARAFFTHVGFNFVSIASLFLVEGL